jgi:hypothetical protein
MSDIEKYVALAEKCSAEVGRHEGEMVWMKFHSQSSVEAFVTGIVMLAALRQPVPTPAEPAQPIGLVDCGECRTQGCQGKCRNAPAEPAQQDTKGEADDTKVICPACVHQFRAIPVQVQSLMLAAGFEPPFTAAPQSVQQAAATESANFYAWQENPYTKVLMKSIEEDYVPKAAATEPEALGGKDESFRPSEKYITGSSQIMADMSNELLEIARLIEGMKRECGMDPESPTAIYNGRLMSIAYKVRALASEARAAPSHAEGFFLRNEHGELYQVSADYAKDKRYAKAGKWLYTSPPPVQKASEWQEEDTGCARVISRKTPASATGTGWRSLSDREWVNIVNSDAVKNEGSDVHGAVCEAFKLIEAKLREKNEATPASSHEVAWRDKNWPDRPARVQRYRPYDPGDWEKVEGTAAREQEDEPHPDDTAVDRFAVALKAKMAHQRAKGYGGWEEGPVERLQAMLFSHIPKGDPVDVGNFAMMLFARGEHTAYEDQWVFDATGKWPGVAEASATGAEPTAIIETIKTELDRLGRLWMDYGKQAGGFNPESGALYGQIQFTRTKVLDYVSMLATPTSAPVQAEGPSTTKPVALVDQRSGTKAHWIDGKVAANLPHGTELYAAAPVHEGLTPLSEERIIDLTEHIDPDDGYYIRIARAVEKAHGITPKGKS